MRCICTKADRLRCSYKSQTSCRQKSLVDMDSPGIWSTVCSRSASDDSSSASGITAGVASLTSEPAAAATPSGIVSSSKTSLSVPAGGDATTTLLNNAPHLEPPRAPPSVVGFTAAGKPRPTAAVLAVEEEEIADRSARCSAFPLPFTVSLTVLSLSSSSTWFGRRSTSHEYTTFIEF